MSNTPTERLVTLERLLKGLPDHLPLKPESSTYVFQPNLDDIEDKGIFGVASHCLEIALRTHSLALKHQELLFFERGPRLETDLMEFLWWTVNKLPSDGEQRAFCDAWVERLIRAAEASGARAQTQKRCGCEYN
jgi:hypothetical protein